MLPRFLPRLISADIVWDDYHKMENSYESQCNFIHNQANWQPENKQPNKQAATQATAQPNMQPSNQTRNQTHNQTNKQANT